MKETLGSLFVPTTRGFLSAFFATLSVFLIGCLGIAMWLKQQNILAAPPLVAEYCIDEKFEFLRDHDLERSGFVTIGSSSSWLNIDLSVMDERLPGSRPLNAAPCYFYANQTAFYAEQLMKHTDNINTLVAVYHMRDFASCPPARTEVVNPAYLEAYINGSLPSWLPYLVKFHPTHILDEAIRLHKEKSKPVAARPDKYGGGVLMQIADWYEPANFDERCYEGVGKLEKLAHDRELDFAVVTVPTNPRWQREYDADRSIEAGWVERLQTELTDPRTVFIDGRSMEVTEEQFADWVHFIYPHHTEFTHFVLDEFLLEADRRMVNLHKETF